MTHLLAAPLAAFGGFGSSLMHLVSQFGLLGIFLVSIVDSSFVPLPVPGLTDIMIVLFAAQKANVFLLVGLSTVASALGGFISYQVGQSGGMDFIEKRTPKRIFKRVTRWMETHAILAVAVPALLPPPMPLSPFVLAAGALKMSRSKFMWAFTLSRLLRHTIAAWLGVRYGTQVLSLWNAFLARWGTPVLIFIWVAILGGVGYAAFKLWKTSNQVGAIKRRPKATAAA